MNQLPQEFAEAWLNKSHEVLGKKLQPYCLYHQLALQTIQSPAVFGGRLSLDDLEKAVLICSIPLPTTPHEAAQYSDSVSSLFDYKKKSWLARFALSRWHRRNEKRYVKDLIKFHYYLRDYSTYPKLSSELKGKGNGANHILSRAGFYIYQTGATVEYVFSLPIGQLNHLCSYFSAMNSGKITFMEDGEQDLAKYREMLTEVMQDRNRVIDTARH